MTGVVGIVRVVGVVRVVGDSSRYLCLEAASTATRAFSGASNL